MARAKKNITSKSSDKDILNFIQAINAKMRTYQDKSLSNEQKELFGESIANRVQNLLKFEKKNETEQIPLAKGVNGAYIPKDMNTVKYLRDVLTRQEAARESEGITPDDEGYTTISTQLNNLLTFKEKLKKTEEQLKDENYQKRQFDETAKVIVDPKLTKAQKKANRDAALKELTARYKYDWSQEGNFGDAIDKIYEMGDQELIDDLRNGKWTGDLMEEVNVKAFGYDYDSEA